MGIFDFLFGKGDKMKKLPTMNKQQEQLLQSILGQLGGPGGGYGQAMDLLQGYLNPQSDLYNNFEQPYLQQFEQQTVPMLAERFSGLGAQGGALSSSGFGQALSSAGSQLQSNLAQMKSGLQRQSIQDILGQSQFALGQSPFAYQQRQGNPGFLPQFLGSFSSRFLGG